ncbi:MAG: exopolyphosphatase [Pseudomonadota bacterium]
MLTSGKGNANGGEGTSGESRRQGELFAGQARSFNLPKPGDDRIGVVDVGSNSVRMVVFEGGRRCPSMVFNEKILCGLGVQLAETRRLDPEGCERALAALQRFVSLAPGLKIGALAGIATAAIREAEDGPAFRDLVERRTGIRLTVASGSDEARLAAQGVLFGDPSALGLVVDLGGASMELCPVGRGRPGTGVTTPLGPQRLGSLDNRLPAVRRHVDRILAAEALRFQTPVQRLYLVGGAWRALGRVQIHLSGHPLPILHELEFDTAEALDAAHYVLKRDRADLAEIPGLSQSRIPSLAHAALLLDRLVEHFEPRHGISISGFGLREGVCYAYLPPAVRTQDPLLSTCAGQEHTRARVPGFGSELADWLLKILPMQNEEDERLVRAACHLSDVSWRTHPDFRARSCMEVVTRVNVSSAGHKGRAFMGACLLNRYKGGRKAMQADPAMTLISEDRQELAQQIGALMRLGAAIAGATPGYLAQCPVLVEDGALVMRPRQSARVFVGEHVEKRLVQAARQMDLEARVE